MKQTKYTLVSLFSGAGGFDWGFHKTGYFETQFACEILPEPAATLAHNLQLDIVEPGELADVLKQGRRAVVRGDVADINFAQISLKPDVLIGGPPCQDFSMAIAKSNETRPGLNGGRGQLYIHFVRAVMYLQPRVFVFENVPGLLSANDGLAGTTIKNDLRHLEQRRNEALAADRLEFEVPKNPIRDYELIFSKVVDGPSVGVPQTRKRLIIIGMRRDLYDAVQLEVQTKLLDRFESALGQPTVLSQFPLTCMEIFEGHVLPDLQEKYTEVMREYEFLGTEMPYPQVSAWRDRVWDQLTIHDIRRDYFGANAVEDTPENRQRYLDAMELHREILSDLNWLGHPVVDGEYPDGTNEPPRLSQAVQDRMHMIPPNENYSFVDNTPWSVPGHGISFIYRRSAPLKPAWTVMAYGGGGSYGYHYERGRSQLTLRERARIQTFSDDFVFASSAGVRAQIGEAVPPLLAQKIARHLIPVLRMCDSADAYPDLD